MRMRKKMGWDWEEARFEKSLEIPDPAEENFWWPIKGVEPNPDAEPLDDAVKKHNAIYQVIRGKNRLDIQRGNWTVRNQKMKGYAVWTTYKGIQRVVAELGFRALRGEGPYFPGKQWFFVESHQANRNVQGSPRVENILNRLARDNSEFGKQFDKADTLSGVDPSIAEHIVHSGLDDGDASDDKVHVSKSTWAAAELKPSQTTMVLGKALGMAMGMLASGKIGGDLGALVSADKHILDGHHRWAATILAAGRKGHVGGFKAALPGEKLLRVLNIVTKGMFKVRNGNPGKGSLSEFKPANVEKMLREFVERGVPGDFPIAAEKVQKILTDNFGGVEEGIAEISHNATLISHDVPSWAPDRAQMPVINPDQVEKVEKALNKGQIDWNAPYKQARRRRSARNVALDLPLLALLGSLQAQHLLFWNAHWEMQGDSQYGDHLLFERMYTAIVDDIDGLAEKLVGMGLNIDPQAQTHSISFYLDRWGTSAESFFDRALKSEQDLQNRLNLTYAALKRADAISLGMDDFLMSLASAHETNIYLLQQRLSAKP